MINNPKNLLIAGLALLFIMATACALYQKNEKEKAEDQAAGTRQAVKQAATIINRYIDNSGRAHAIIAADSNHLTHNWYKNGTAISGGLVDTVAEALKIAKDKLQQVTQIATLTQAARLKAEKRIDSLQRLTYYYRDKYLQLAYHPADSTGGNGSFGFKYNDSLTIVQYWKKSWLLGAKKSYIDISPADPRTTINGIKHLVVEQPPSQTGLRLQAAAGYSFARQKAAIGPALQLDIKRVSITGTYYYDFDSQTFRPTLAARYDLIRF